jgi:hypothetical protein
MYQKATEGERINMAYGLLSFLHRNFEELIGSSFSSENFIQYTRSLPAQSYLISWTGQYT